MVYCGKPSKGCSNCRERKIRLTRDLKDQREPCCGQCEKRCQNCPGYRNLVDLMFRDESSTVIKKAIKKPRELLTRDAAIRQCPDPPTNCSAPPPESISFDPLKPADTHTTSRLGGGASQVPCLIVSDQETNGTTESSVSYASSDNCTSTRLSLQVTAHAPASMFEQQGIAYFFAKYVNADGLANVQPFDFVFEIWRPLRCLDVRQDDSVMAAMAAVGLAGLSQLKTSSDLLTWSRRSYGTALRLTNNAIRRSSDAVKDTTLLSVLILSLYELLAGHGSQAAHAWQEHVNGAAILARIRGVTQFSSRAGIRMFNVLKQTVLVNCIQRHQPLPPTLAQLEAELENVVSVLDEGPGWRLSGSIQRILQLRHDVCQAPRSSADDTIAQLLVTDKELSDMVTVGVTAHKRGYRRIRVSRQNGNAFGEFCHIYISPAEATAWNTMRSIRMLLHETIIQLILAEPSHGNEAHQLVLARSTWLFEKLRNAILATVPQYLGNVKSKDVGAVDNDASIQRAGFSETLHAREPPIHLASTGHRGLGLAASLSATSPHRGVYEELPYLPASPPTQAGRDEGIRMEEIMTLASASNTIIWPLYLVGRSRLCTVEVNEYVVARLMDIYRDTGLAQARAVASMVANNAMDTSWASTRSVLDKTEAPQESIDESVM
ncbi:hypothetical protein F5X68DRAFT_178583 [Plectosphaerella plurivora]|uniref:Zn(2)-C6 fungal-type domain-containing protein n=1 Tax=Plectosphaerella plurivora TaxID=936078 RepID=A0A9P8V031_9PEZI|nr:hypothetical protein F5X68DRAFT_178583 [Plectosphaerella plurivora]